MTSSSPDRAPPDPRKEPAPADPVPRADVGKSREKLHTLRRQGERTEDQEGAHHRTVFV